MSRFDADLVIAGAGCAGLSALWHAMHSEARDRRIIVIDREPVVGDDRTWAFWGTRNAPLAHLADRRWDSLQVRFPDWAATSRLGRGLTYARVRQRDFDTAIVDEASTRRNVRFVHQPVLDIRDEPGGAVVQLPEGELRAPLVLQSMRMSPDDESATVRHPLRQHFAGWEVRTQHAVFDPAVATLMDFDAPQLDGTAFFYVLPDAPDCALIEHTMFSVSPEPAAFHLEQVRERLEQMGAGEVSIERTEYGIIPMEDRRFHQQTGEHVWNIGTVGGMTKPTTGYSFQRIQAQTQHLVGRWAAGLPLAAMPATSQRYAFADRTLLSILHHRPELGRPIFERLFRTTAMDDVLAFLDEDTSLRQDAAMMSRLPWAPFVRAAAGEVMAGTRSVGRRAGA